MTYFAQLHTVIYTWASELIERRPGLGYVVATATGTTGVMGLVESTTKIISLIAACIGVVVGLYTLNVQRKQLARLNAELADKIKKT